MHIIYNAIHKKKSYPAIRRKKNKISCPSRVCVARELSGRPFDRRWPQRNKQLTRVPEAGE